MTQGFEFRMPRTMFYGTGSFSKIGEQAALYGEKCLIISDRIMEELGNVQACADLLKEQYVESAAYLDVNHEPADTHVEEALAQLRKENCDMIVALGGGSCIDTAKAVSVLAEKGGHIEDYTDSDRKSGYDSLPLLAVPTTAGTGSEVTSVTVITNIATEVKMMIKDPALIPDVAIVDPALTVTSPPHITANTGIDALCHAMEAYISNVSQPLTDKLALSAIERIIFNIRSSFADGNDMQAREQMALAAMEAGIAFSNASVCLVHGMSRPVGALFHVPHGVSNAMLLPAVMEFSKEACTERLAVIGRLCDPELEGRPDIEAAGKAVQEVKKLCRDLNIPNMKQWGIEEEAFYKALPKMASDALASGSPSKNPRVASHEEIMALYDRCYSYNFK